MDGRHRIDDFFRAGFARPRKSSTVKPAFMPRQNAVDLVLIRIPSSYKAIHNRGMEDARKVYQTHWKTRERAKKGKQNGIENGNTRS